MIHIQFWLFSHKCYQDAFRLPPSPFVYIHSYASGTSDPDESFYFCLQDAVPTLEARSSQICPHILLREVRSDIRHEHYGLVFSRLSDFSATFTAAAHQPKFLQYP